MNRKSKLVLIPINGLVNRLRAMASAAIFAEQHSMSLDFFWIATNVMNCNPLEVFSSEFCQAHFKSVDNNSSLDFLASQREEIFAVKGSDLLVAGGRSGEQKYLAKVKETLIPNAKILRLIIKSGGLFHDCEHIGCVDCKSFREKRADFYRAIGSSTPVMSEVDFLESKLGSDFIGLHIRQTDKSRDERVSINRMIRELKKELKKKDLYKEFPRVFVCGDDPRGLEEVSRLLNKLRIENLVRLDIDFNRENSSNAISAYSDWLMLSRATKIFFYGNTSFSYEAAVLGGVFDQSVHLEPRGKRVVKEFQILTRSISHKLRN
jgi:hypothetical protein